MKNIKDNKVIKSLILVLQGAIVGTGAILPGVSGGVLCVAFGIYGPMMALFSHPIKSFKQYYKMFIPFFIGWAAGFILLAGAVEAMFAVSASAALMLFFGLICGTLPELFKTSEKSDSEASWTPFVLTLALAFFFFIIMEKQFSDVTAEPSVFGYLACGLIWGLSLIVPGLSSSSLLIYMGLYEPMTAGIARLDFSVLIPLACGLLAVVFSLARLVNVLYEKHYAVVSRIILGIITASSLKIVPTEFDGAVSAAVSLVCFGVGFAAARFMDKADGRNADNGGMTE